MKRLELFLAIAEHTAEILQDAMAESRKAVNRLYSTSEDTRDKLQKAAEVMKYKVSNDVEGMCEEITRVAEGLGEVVGKARV